jgi:ABC-type phosphate transport system auxiliary subunit
MKAIKASKGSTGNTLTTSSNGSEESPTNTGNTHNYEPKLAEMIKKADQYYERLGEIDTNIERIEESLDLGSGKQRSKSKANKLPKHKRAALKYERSLLIDEKDSVKEELSSLSSIIQDRAKKAMQSVDEFRIRMKLGNIKYLKRNPGVVENRINNTLNKLREEDPIQLKKLHSSLKSSSKTVAKHQAVQDMLKGLDYKSAKDLRRIYSNNSVKDDVIRCMSDSLDQWNPKDSNYDFKCTGVKFKVSAKSKG